ncbi:unnamed protein product [Arctogadus glacialis]
MKLSWAISALSAVVCTTACMVLFGQHALWTKQSGDDEEQRLKYETFNATFQEKLFVKNTVQNQLDQQRKYLKEMEGEREKADLEQQQKAAELSDCKANKKKMEREFADTETEVANVKNNLSKMRAAWAEHIATLKRDHMQPSPICAFIKKDTVGARLCGPEAAVVAAPAAAA